MLNKELHGGGKSQRKSKAHIIKESTHLEKMKSYCFLSNAVKQADLQSPLSYCVRQWEFWERAFI